MELSQSSGGYLANVCAPRLRDWRCSIHSRMQRLRVVGSDVPRIEGREKVTGATRYAVDVKLPGMLSARILRSQVPHARLVRVDVSRARDLPGVHAVLTGAAI